MSNGDAPKQPKRLMLFACGALAPLSVYIVFYANHVGELLENAKSLSEQGGVLALLLVAILFLGVAALSGGWALFCESPNYKAAFSAGLGFPALILSGSGAFAPGAGKRTASVQEVHLASLAPVAPMFAAAEPGVFRRALSIVFNPVGTVVEAQNVELEERTEALQAAEARAAQLRSESERLAGQNAEMAQAVSAMRTQAEEALQFREQFAQARVSLQQASEQAVSLRTEIAHRDARIVELSVRNSELDRRAAELGIAVEELVREREDVQKALKGPDEGHEALLHRVGQLEMEIAQQKESLQEYARVVPSLAKEGGTRLQPALQQALESANTEPVRLSVIEAVRQIPQAQRTPAIRRQLEVLERDPSPRVRSAVDGLR